MDHESKQVMERANGGMTAIPEVLASARYVVERAAFVKLHESAARSWAQAQDPDRLAAPATPAELSFSGDQAACANLTLLLSCLNFCFWSDEPWSVEFRGRTWTRTYAMYAGVLQAIDDDPEWLTAQRWAAVDEAAVSELFRGVGQIPLLRQRREVLNETGQCLLTGFAGQFVRAAEMAQMHAQKLAYLIAESFPSFRDVASYEGREIALLKRAQICAADLHGLWRRNGHAGLAAMDQLTVFADYRLPQYLRHVGIIELDAELDARIERRDELPAGSAEEVELRCATVVAGELIRQALGGVVPIWHIDFTLWQHAHDPDVRIQHHRTRTVFY